MNIATIFVEILKWYFIVVGVVTTIIVAFCVLSHGALAQQDILYQGEARLPYGNKDGL